MKYSHEFSRKHKRLTLIACSLLWVSAFVLTHIPLRAIPQVAGGDKTLHFVGYLVLGCVFSLTLLVRKTARVRRIFAVVVVMMLYASVDEITQLLVNRHATLTDWTADVAGAIAGVILVEVILVIAYRTARKTE